MGICAKFREERKWPAKTYTKFRGVIFRVCEFLFAELYFAFVNFCSRSEREKNFFFSLG